MPTIEILTAVLVLVTGYYAYQNQRMATEMRSSREQSVLPKLAVDTRFWVGDIAAVRLTNVGQGVALNINVELAFEPTADSGFPRDARQWGTSVLAPGQSVEFVPPRHLPVDESEARPRPLTLEELSSAYRAVAVTGRLFDSLGKEHRLEEGLVLHELWQLRAHSQEKSSATPLEEAAGQIVRRLESIDRYLSDLVNVGRGTDTFQQMRAGDRRRSPILPRSAGDRDAS